jgi:hypothetical protein
MDQASQVAAMRYRVTLLQRMDATTIAVAHGTTVTTIQRRCRTERMNAIRRPPSAPTA